MAVLYQVLSLLEPKKCSRSAVFFAEKYSHESVKHHQVVIVAVAATAETGTITTAFLVVIEYNVFVEKSEPITAKAINTIVVTETTDILLCLF